MEVCPLVSGRAMREDQHQVVQEVFDSYPNEEPLKDFDDFFVGGTLHHNLPSHETDQRAMAWQLTGVSDVEALKKGEVEKEEVELENDLDLFVSEKLDILDEEQYEALFLAMKLRAFELYHFLDIKSAALGDIPIKEKDLVLDVEDRYLLDYLKQSLTDYHAVATIATLTAYENMGIHTVRFRQQDGCPLCRALDGAIFEIRMLVGLLGGGGHVSHTYCDCQMEPVVWREMYSGPLEGYLNKEEVLHQGTRIVNMPVEMETDILSLSEKLDFDCIEFVDMKNHLRENLEIKDTEGVVSIQEDGVLFVHNSYVGSYGPVDFLREFASVEALPDRISPSSLENAEIYLMGGRRVAKKDGKYWDPVTGERLK